MNKSSAYLGTVAEFMDGVPTTPEILRIHLNYYKNAGLLQENNINEARIALERVWSGQSNNFIKESEFDSDNHEDNSHSARPHGRYRWPSPFPIYTVPQAIKWRAVVFNALADSQLLVGASAMLCMMVLLCFGTSATLLAIVCLAPALLAVFFIASEKASNLNSLTEDYCRVIPAFYYTHFVTGLVNAECTHLTSLTLHGADSHRRAKESLRVALDAISGTFEVATGYNCNACVKTIHVVDDHTCDASPLNQTFDNLEIRTMCGDSALSQLGEHIANAGVRLKDTPYHELLCGRALSPCYTNSSTSSEVSSECAWLILKNYSNSRGERKSFPVGLLLVWCTHLNGLRFKFNRSIGAELASSVLPLLELCLGEDASWIGVDEEAHSLDEDMISGWCDLLPAPDTRNLFLLSNGERTESF